MTSGRKISHQILLGTALVSSALALPTAAAAQAGAAAQTEAREFDIPAQPLSSALIAFSRETRLELFYSASLTNGLTSPGVSGRLAPVEALGRLLAGTGLSYRFTNRNTITIEPAPQAEAGTVQLGTLRVEGSSGRGDSGGASGADGSSDRIARRVKDDLFPPRDFISEQTEAAGFESARAVTIVSRETIDQTQPSNIFDTLRDVPGVSVDGGPRVSGMRFNIRGYGDAEDVMVKVDDLPKTFEKYRMNGMFIEPEMIKSVEVLRGPQATSPAIGGTIVAQTKDAADFLREGRRFGAWAKVGYGTNNKEMSGSAILYARPFDWLDIVYNHARRGSEDIATGDGEDLKASAIDSRSHLFKLSVFPFESLKLTTSVVHFRDKGLQAYDAISLFNANFGYVIRDIDDLTVTQTVRFNPATRFIDFKFVYGEGHTDLLDTVLPGWAQNTAVSPTIGYCEGFNFFNRNGTPGTASQSASRCKGNRYDTYDFKNITIDATNRAILWEDDGFSLGLLTGFQYQKNEKVVKLHYDNPASSTRTLFNSGNKTVESWFVEPSLTWGRFHAAAGYRRDKYHIEATGSTLATLEMYGFDPEIRSKTEALSLQLSYDLIPDKLKLFANYGEGFRPALLDEYYMNAGQSSYCPWQESCDGLFLNQKARSIDGGASYHDPNLFGTELGLTSKVTLFRAKTKNLINSFTYNFQTQAISQTGHDKRHGIELESRFAFRNLSATLTYSDTDGNIYYDTVVAPLYTVPGSHFNVQLHANLAEKWDLNAGYRRISDRTVLAGLYTGANAVYGTQEGYQLFNAGVRFAPNDNVSFRLVGENLGDKYYNLDGGFAGTLGMPAMGRNVKLFVEVRF